MKFLLTAVVMLLVGCSTAVPVKQKFPPASPSLMNSCPELKTIGDTEKLSEVLIVVTQNYSQYHECRVKVDAWIEWYNKQQKEFDK